MTSRPGTASAALGSRALFPDLEPPIYLNHAAVAPPSAPVVRAVQACMADYAWLGLGAVAGAMAQREGLKAQLAGLLGCDPADLALTGSTTRGLIDLSCCIPFAERDRILGFEGEFPANITPWRRAAEHAGASFELLPQAGLDDDAVLAEAERALAAGRVRLVACSVVQFSTGRAMPVAELARLAHAHGAEICVDGIQAVGVMPVDVRALGVDYLAGGAHKWLMGIEGVGYVYAAPAAAARLRPRTAGWLSHEDPLGFLLRGPGLLDYDRPIRRSVDFLEGHSLSAVGCAALGAAVELIAEIGVPAIQEHVRAYLDALEARLVERGYRSARAPGSRSGILAVAPPPGEDPLAHAAAFAARGVAISTPDGWLRFSPHWPNALDEVARI